VVAPSARLARSRRERAEAVLAGAGRQRTRKRRTARRMPSGTRAARRVPGGKSHAGGPERRRGSRPPAEGPRRARPAFARIGSAGL